MTFKIMCDCGKEGDIMSAVKKKFGSTNAEIVELTFICPYCGNGDAVSHYLYNEDDIK